MSALGATLGLGGNNANFTASSALPQLANPIGGQQAQDSVTAAQGGIGQQQAFLNALQAQNGVGNQSAVFNQLQGVANGTGPNPAQAMLNQSTGQNVANQAALMAGQRGASQNAGLIARQAGQQGASTQQQAAGQGATLQANQSLNALNSMGSLANQQVANQQGALGQLNSGLQGEQGALLGQLTAQNQGVLGNQSNMNSVNGSLANTNAQANAKTYGGLTSGIGSAIGFAQGGQIPMMADGGLMAQSSMQINSDGPRSMVGRHLNELTFKGGKPNSAIANPETPIMFASGGKVPALVSPGEVYLKPEAAQAAAQGKVDPLKAGEHIKGQAKVEGNSYANDTVPKTLEAGGIVIPRSIMQSANPEEEAIKFIRNELAKSRTK